MKTKIGYLLLTISIMFALAPIDISNLTGVSIWINLIVMIILFLLGIVLSF